MRVGGGRGEKWVRRVREWELWVVHGIVGAAGEESVGMDVVGLS